MIPPIVVCTYPRSGSSLTCGLLHEAGVWVGECKPRNAFNPKGFFENRVLMDMARLAEITWADVEPILREQGWNGERWLVKVKATRWRPWLPINPTFLKVRRSTEAIVASRLSKKARDEAAVRHAIAEMTRIMESEIQGYTVWPERLIEGDETEFRAVWKALGLPWSNAFVDRSLWHF